MVATARLLNEHGIRLGDRLRPVRLPCTDGRSRTVADSPAVQVVTFSTSGDCSASIRHLSGLEEIWRGRRLAPGQVDQFFVTYTLPARQAEVLAQYAATGTRPVCIDQGGMLWTAHDISHTPVTVLLGHGRIIYAHDAPLDSPDARAEFVHAITVLAR